MTHPSTRDRALAGATSPRPPRRWLASLPCLVLLWPAVVILPIAAGAPPAVAIACVVVALPAYFHATLFGGSAAERAKRRARFRVGPVGGAWPRALLTAFVLVVASASLHIAARSADAGATGQEFIGAYMARGPLHVAVVLLVGALVAPLMEEVAFRGALTTALARRFGEPPALVGSSLLFAVVHQRPAAMPQLLLAGGMLGLLAWAARSVWASAVAHTMLNALALAANEWPRVGGATDHVSRPLALGVLLASVVAFAWLIVGLRRATARPVDHPNPGDR